MESHAPLVSISAVANDKKVDETPHELLDSWLVSVNINKTSLVWQYFAMVNVATPLWPSVRMKITLPKLGT